MLRMTIVVATISLLAAAALSQESGAVVQNDHPANTWVLRHTDGPNITWENGIAYDPATRQIVWHGGHAWGYPQSNYTHIYDLKTNTWRDSQAPYRPQRRCLVMLNYLDSCGLMVTTQGGTGHGSIQEGQLGGDYKRVFRGDPRGPWLYDVAADRWENTRVLPPIWRRVAHAQCAYDASTDSLVWIAGDKLGLYVPRTNRISYRDLPKELHNRLAYGIAADPVAGKVVLFGGSGPGGWQWVKGDRAEAWKNYVHDDTWIYDVKADAWKQAQPKVRPPKGMPLHDHRFIVMLYHDPSGTIIMQQQPLNEHEPDTTKWPATQFWAFDMANEDWTLLAMKNTPPFLGLLAYASHEDLLVLVGGGKDGEVKTGDGKVSYRPSLSKQLWTCRVEVAGKKGRPRPPMPASDQPWRPGGLVASVESDKKVVLRWNANSEKDLAGYNVYRATGAEVETGEGKLLTAKPIQKTNWIDDAVDLSDGVARSYWVTAVNEGGIESGASPLAYTFPNPPTALAAKLSDDKKSITVTWDWPADNKVAGFNVYHLNNHWNTHGQPAEKVKAWYDSWKPISEKPISGILNEGEGRVRVATFTIPADDAAKHHYFYVRAVNVLGQEGFYTDIVSATDRRFRP